MSFLFGKFRGLRRVGSLEPLERRQLSPNSFSSSSTSPFMKMAPSTLSISRPMSNISQELDRELTERELKMTNLLSSSLQTDQVDVMDVSGGCGASFRVEVTSPLFQGKKLLEQHKMIYEILSGEVKEMHALTIHTKAPKK
eukprot:TRINITY_DN2276_c4_g1_i1.p1 TRINITY_DN2276_c4_g1~~TRINITY_DN2276_c4_g1_i1.p1  ORF type:complete len:141 (+),score=30.20 TRINITY_DN2276_c4_g1_i1:131-553(+)